MRIAILGAGVFGVAAANELRARGHAVTLVDRGPIPRPDAASTDITKAVRMDYGTDDLYLELMEEALVGWRTWNRAWARPLFHETGFLLLSSHPLVDGDFELDSYERVTARGHAVERLDEATIARRFTAFRAGRFVDGYLNPQGGWAESGAVVAAMLAEARAAGVEVIDDAGDAALVGRGEEVVGVRTASGRSVHAECTVVATGTWTATLLPELSAMLSTVAQPIVHFAPADVVPYASPRHVTWAADIARTGWYGFPSTPDGLVKIANHGPGVRCSPDAPREDGVDHLARFTELVRDIMPGLAAAPCVRQRICLYTDTPDGDFFIDRHPERPGLVVASGGSGHAFKFAPVLGPLVADVVEGAHSPRLDRFRWRGAAASTRREAARFGGVA